MNPFPHSAFLPPPHLGVDGFPCGKIVRQQSPGTPRPQHVPVRVAEFADVKFPRPTGQGGGGKIGFDIRPLRIGQIGRVGLAYAHAPDYPISLAFHKMGLQTGS